MLNEKPGLLNVESEICQMSTANEQTIVGAPLTDDNRVKSSAPQLDRDAALKFLRWRYGDQPAQIVHGDGWRGEQVESSGLDALLDRVGNERFYFHIYDLNESWKDPASHGAGYVTSASERHVVGTRFIGFDFDAAKFGEPDEKPSDHSRAHYQQETARITQALEAGFAKLEIKPSAMWFSGPAGRQGLFKLDRTISYQRAKELTSKLAEALGSDPSIKNPNRILRVPGSINHKTEHGRVPTVASSFWPLSDLVTSVETLEAALAPVQVPGSSSTPRDNVTIDWNNVTIGWLKSVDDLGDRVEQHAKLTLRHAGNAKEHEAVHVTIGHRVDEKGKYTPYNDDSRMMLALVGALDSADYTPAQIAGIALDEKFRDAFAHLYKPKMNKRRAIERAIQKVRSDAKAESDGLIVSATDHMARARKFIEKRRSNLRYYRDDYMDYHAARYVPVSDSMITAGVYDFLDGCLKYVGTPPNVETVPFQPGQKSVAETVAAVKAVCIADPDVEQPSWLDGRTEPPAHECISCPTGVLHLPSGRLYDATPLFFTRNAIDYDYDPEAAAPEVFLQALHQYWPNDPESIVALQDAFGYFISGDTSQQKILLLLGPPRCGKGTIGRTLTRVVGANNVTAPTLNSLSGPFGLEPLIGRQLALVPDARLGRMSDSIDIAEKILSISGEDQISVPRKHKTAWEGRLGVRFMLMANELPNIADDSGALGNRLVILPMTESFLGREDRDLEAKIAAELPGILRWSIEGYRRLRERRRFQEPASGTAVKNAMLRLSSAVRTFTEDCCVLEGAAEVTKDGLYEGWKQWCRDNGDRPPGGKEMLGTKLLAARAGRVSPIRMTDGNKRPWGYRGIRLLTSDDDAALMLTAEGKSTTDDKQDKIPF
jgi:putative DNA primase/helicase